MIGSIYDLAAVVGVKGPTVIARRMCQASHFRTVRVHRVDLEVSVPRRGENDFLAVPRDRGLGVVDRRGKERTNVAAVRPDRVDVVVVQGPDVAARAIRSRWATGSRAER